VRLTGSKLSEKKTLRLCEHFVAGTPARTAAELVGVNKNTATLFYHRLREIIAVHIEDESPVQGEVEIDELFWRQAQRA
jgi:transposase